MARRRDCRELVLLGSVLVGTFLLVVLLVRRPGHWWGDDWALYVRQADGLIGLRIGEVITDNRFTVEQSGLPEFSPPVYPWGYSVLLAPFVAVLGTDLDRLVVAQAAFFCWFLGAWWLLARRRVGALLAFLGLAVLALSPQFVRWAELIQSELAFMAVALTGLVMLDRPSVRRSLVDPTAPWWPPVVLGLLGAAAFEVRREGFAMMAAIGVAQLIDVWPQVDRWWRAGHTIRRRRPAGGSTSTDSPAEPVAPGSSVGARVGFRLAAPWAAALGLVLMLQIVLPATLVPGYEGNGLHNVIGFAPAHLGHVMESLGLQQPGAPTATVLDRPWAGAAAAVVFVLLTVAGLVIGARRRPSLHLPVAAFAVMALLIGGSFRMPGSRYVAVIGPMALLFCLVALRAFSELARATGARGLRGAEDHPDRNHARSRAVGTARLACTGVAVVLVGSLALGNLVRVADLVADARRFAAEGQVVWGPDHPASLEMFEAVVEHTEPDAVVGFFKARAMTQRTDRRAIQVDEWHPVERTLDVLTHVVVRNTPDDLATLDALFPPHAAPAPATPQVLWSSPHFTLLHLGN